MLGSRRRPTIKTKNNNTELLNPEEGEDNTGDAVGKKHRSGWMKCVCSFQMVPGKKLKTRH